MLTLIMGRLIDISVWACTVILQLYVHVHPKLIHESSESFISLL